jgi:hypothetical protein
VAQFSTGILAHFSISIYNYSQAPLPFVGQKRMFASEFRKS